METAANEYNTSPKVRICAVATAVSSILCVVGYGILTPLEEPDVFRLFYIALAVMVLVTIPAVAIALKGVAVGPGAWRVRTRGAIYIVVGLAIAAVALVLTFILSNIAETVVGSGASMIASGLIVLSLMITYMGFLTLVSGVDIREEVNRGKPEERRW